MIKIIKDNTMMDVNIQGNAEEIANEYAALTYWLMSKHRNIYDRAMDYLERHKEDL